MADEQTAVNPYQTPQAEIADTGLGTSDAVLAERGTRLGAHLLDMLFFVIAMIPIFFIMESNNDTAVAIGAGITIIAGLILVGLNINYLYQNGQTIGKRIVGIKIVRGDGERCGLARIIFLRNFVIGLLGNIPLIGPFISLADPLFIFRADRRCIHDMIADTKVIVA
ncbi:MAG: RDD family protein [Thioalkalispiraceae bacterium]|jgi:uncharacterized RDD family membrane protein YckC